MGQDCDCTETLMLLSKIHRPTAGQAIINRETEMVINSHKRHFGQKLRSPTQAMEHVPNSKWSCLAIQIVFLQPNYRLFYQGATEIICYSMNFPLAS